MDLSKSNNSRQLNEQLYIYICKQRLKLRMQYLEISRVLPTKVLEELKDSKRCSYEKLFFFFVNKKHLSLLIFAVSDNQNSNCLGHQI